MLAGIVLLVSGLATLVSAQWNEAAYQQRLVDGRTGCKDLDTLKIIYWGADGGSEPELQEVCASHPQYSNMTRCAQSMAGCRCAPGRSMTWLASLSSGNGSGQPIQLQISDHNLSLTAEAVTSCQHLGTRVLLALGGDQNFSSSPCHYGFDTTSDASGTASDLYDAFILGSAMPQVTDDTGSQVWPDNTAFFDGFVFDFECPSLQTRNQIELLTTFGGALMGLAASSPVANGINSITCAAAPRGYPVSCVGALAPSCADPLMGPGPGYLISSDSYGLSWVLLQDYLGSAMCSPGNQLASCLDSWQAW